MKKLVEVLNKEIAKKSERISSIMNTSVSAEDISNNDTYNQFMNKVELVKGDYNELQKLNQIKSYIESLDTVLPSTPKSGRRGRPKKNQ